MATRVNNIGDRVYNSYASPHGFGGTLNNQYSYVPRNPGHFFYDPNNNTNLLNPNGFRTGRTYGNVGVLGDPGFNGNPDTRQAFQAGSFLNTMSSTITDRSFFNNPHVTRNALDSDLHRNRTFQLADPDYYPYYQDPNVGYYFPYPQRIYPQISLYDPPNPNPFPPGYPYPYPGPYNRRWC